jgi:signal transduction histidine kinase
MLLRRLQARDPRVVDGVAAAVLIVLAQADTWFGVATGSKAVLVPCTLVIPATVAWRTRAPLAAVSVAMAAVVIQSLAASPPQAVWMIVVVMLLAYSAGAELGGGQAVLALAILLAGMGIDESQASDESLAGYVFVGLITVLPWVAGRAVQARQRGGEETARAAVVAERSRIARELHDMVAHAVSIMVVKVEAADAVLDRRPDQAHEQLAAVKRTGREALAEMTRLLGMLRADGEALELAPQPGIGRLPELIGEVQAAGLPVDYAAVGTERALPPGVDLAAYRVIQEALTNARKHGGDRTKARVRLTYAEHALTIDVDDDGRGSTNGHSGGHGLVGMRERLGLYGGTLEAGPAPAGGYAVHAVIPLEEAS